MAKIGEIREGIRESILRSCDSEDCGNTPCDATCPYLNKLVDVCLHRLHSQDVFIAKHGFYSDLMEPLIEGFDAIK